MTPTELGTLFLNSRLIVHYRKSVDADAVKTPHKLKNLLEQHIPVDVRLAVIDAPPMKDAVDAFVVFKTRELAEPYLKEKHESLLVSGIEWDWQCKHYAMGLKAATDEAEARGNVVETTVIANEIMVDDPSLLGGIEEYIQSQSGLEEGEETSGESESNEELAVDSTRSPGIGPSPVPTSSDIINDFNSEFKLDEVISVASVVVDRSPRRNLVQVRHISTVSNPGGATTSVEPLAPEVQTYLRHEKIHPRTGLDKILLSVWKDAIKHGEKPPYVSRNQHLDHILREVRRNGFGAHLARGEMQAIAYKGFGYLVGH